MSSYDGRQQSGHGETLTPMHIANHPLFTPREKIELLQAIRQQISGLSADGYGSNFATADVDTAIGIVRRKVRAGASQRFAPGVGG